MKKKNKNKQKSSFEGAKNWITEVKYHEPEIPIILVGNKCDLLNNYNFNQNCNNNNNNNSNNQSLNPIQIEAQKYCKNKDYKYIETSAKTGFNIHQLFVTVGL